jgi:UDP-N-acetylglucosamine--N-acetylmuramyl-(pentapeptide) pyrophosphoryl-undecaprenol N-acetylglucosamine transferase
VNADSLTADRRRSTTPAPGLTRLAIACGGTAGHVHPALAVAEAWRRLVPAVDLVFVGTAEGFAARVVPAHGHRLVTVRAAPFFRVGVGGKLRAVTSTLAGTIDARRVLRRERVGLVLGFGGYATAPVALAARSLAIPIVLHEANAVAGMANVLVGKVADGVLLGCETARASFGGRGIVTGIPLRPEFLAAPPRRAWTGNGVFRILVAGGSEGSALLDARVPAVLARVRARCLAIQARSLANQARSLAIEVQHQVGDGDRQSVEAAYATAGIPALITPFIDDMAAAYERADLAIVSAGAVTLVEVATMGLPVVIAPLPSAALDHQSANARAFAAVTGSRWVRHDAWDPEALAVHVSALIGDPVGWQAASDGVRRWARADAAGEIVAACERLLNARSADAREAL